MEVSNVICIVTAFKNAIFLTQLQVKPMVLTVCLGYYLLCTTSLRCLTCEQ